MIDRLIALLTALGILVLVWFCVFYVAERV